MIQDKTKDICLQRLNWIKRHFMSVHRYGTSMKEVSGLGRERLYKVTLISLEVTCMPFGSQMGPLVCGISFQN